MNMNQNHYNKHDYDYILVLDFECTCEENYQIEQQEIIEFPVVVVDLLNNQIWDEKFHLYLKPIYKPLLSQFCKNLTHITQDQVDQGTDLSDALSQFDDWLHSTGIISSRFTFVTVGNFDLQVFLKKECLLKGIAQENYLKSFINLSIKFKNFFQLNYTPGLRGMMNLLSLDFLGNQHSGIDDAYNTAVLVINLIQRGALFRKSDVWFIDFIHSPPKYGQQQPRYSQNVNTHQIEYSDTQDNSQQDFTSLDYSANNHSQNANYFHSQFLVSTPSSSTSNTSFSNSNETFFIDFSFEENGPKLKKKQKKTKQKLTEKPPEQKEIAN